MDATPGLNRRLIATTSILVALLLIGVLLAGAVLSLFAAIEGASASASASTSNEARGMSSNAQATSLSFISAFLFDPVTASNFSFTAADFARATDENAGLNATSSASADTTAGILGFSIDIDVNGAGVFDAIISDLGAMGMANATSP